MINKTTQRKLKRVIGLEYTDEVLTILNTAGKVNKRGLPYKAQYIRTVFCGFRNNPDVEEAIFELYRIKKESAEERKALLNNKKPEAATSGS